jgi:hypothetical protein
MENIFPAANCEFYKNKNTYSKEIKPFGRNEIVVFALAEVFDFDTHEEHSAYTMPDGAAGGDTRGEVLLWRI